MNTLGGFALAKRKKRNQTPLSFMKKVSLVLIIFITTLIVLSSKTEEVVEELQLDTQELFIEEVARYAVPLKDKYGLLPSVTIAQAILESNWGKSSLSQQENNYFGIKGSSDEKKYATLEYEDEWKEIHASFRSYPSLEASVEDYGKLLAYGTNWNPELYHQVIEASTPSEVAYALKNAGYATDPTYPEKILSIVERYNLEKYDQSKTED